MNADWQDKANCVSVGVELFYDDERNGDALDVCWGCPVESECRAYIDAMEHGPRDVHGVAAGETGTQRIKRRWPKYRKPVTAAPGPRRVLIPPRVLAALAANGM